MTKRSVIAAALVLLSGMALGAQTEAVVQRVDGKVEVLAKTGDWQPLAGGMRIATGSTISTGFNSQAWLEVGTSLVVVRPLTRMRLDELVQAQGTVKTDLFLQAGRVRADVKTAEGLRQDFRIRTPISTAAVRGTSLEAGVGTLRVIWGPVAFANALNQTRMLTAGDESSTGGDGPPAPPEKGRRDAASVRAYTGPSGDGLERRGRPRRTQVTIELVW